MYVSQIWSKEPLTRVQYICGIKGLAKVNFELDQLGAASGTLLGLLSSTSTAYKENIKSPLSFITGLTHCPTNEFTISPDQLPKLATLPK